MTAIAWIRREMRVRDNTALVRAAQDHDTVVPFYVVDTDYFDQGDADDLGLGWPRVKFWHDSLRELRDLLRDRGTDLIVRQGSPHEELQEIVAGTDADAVYTNDDHTPYARQRDEEISDALDVPFTRFEDVMMHAPDTIYTNQGDPYQVFTYYWKTWRDMDKPEPRDVPVFAAPDVNVGRIPSLSALGWDDPGMDVMPGGREAGLARIDAFMDDIAFYGDRRDEPAADATSRLSPHLKFGTVSIREAFHAAEDARTPETSDGVEAWQRQLAWRDFYMQVLHHHPRTVTEPFQEQYASIDWETDPGYWEAFVNGETGYPFIDAGMRQLQETGWMHNRARMAVTSFAAKDLHLDWQDVHDHFNAMFVDAELSAMIGGIQWAYSIGTDAQPYFRVFNPWTQGEDHDPGGDYIRARVDELEDVPDEYVHRPHEMPQEVQEDAGCIIGEDYPEPIVDHAAERERAIERFEQARD